MTSSESADLFARSWSLYDHITEHNYMFHQEIYAEFSELLKQRHDGGQYRMLDLGCGNARYLVPALIESLPGHYQGVDLSQVALDEACAHVETYDFPESRSTLTEMAQAAGLSHSRLISQYVQHHTLLFAGDKLKTTEE